MNPQPDHHSVRRITLPSGRSIEVVRFNDADRDATAGSARTRSLHICPDCGSNLVQPMAWSEATDGHWELVLECPNCTWTESGTFDRRQVEELEEQLDDGLTRMLEDLRRVARVNMSEDVERFVSALQADQILPEDF